MVVAGKARSPIQVDRILKKKFEDRKRREEQFVAIDYREAKDRRPDALENFDDGKNEKLTKFGLKDPVRRGA